MSSPPTRMTPDDKWEHLELYRRVREAVSSIPIHFKSETFIEGISAIDIFTLNTVLGAAIENQVVSTLNQIRPVWDPDEQYALYRFERQSQAFPDVLLRRYVDNGSGEPPIIMGIELKGWYLLAKEGEPSFRYSVTPAACNAQDLIVVVPWSLSNVIAGSPRVFVPFIETAKYAAEFRNYHWQSLRNAQSDTTIDSPGNVSPYPKKTDQIADVPRSDTGKNFGRFARTGIMDAYLERAKLELLCGIAAEHWLAFFKIFQDRKEQDRILQDIERLRNRVRTSPSTIEAAKLEAIDRILDGMKQLLD